MEDRRGFTIIELLTVIVVGAILLTITITQFGTVSRRFAVREASNTFAALHARTRAHAIEVGQTIELHVDLDGDSVWIARNDTTLELVRLDQEFGVDVTGSASSYTLCMNSRGYGDEGCNSFSTSAQIRFQSGADSATVTMLPLGQLAR